MEAGSYFLKVVYLSLDFKKNCPESTSLPFKMSRFGKKKKKKKKKCTGLKLMCEFVPFSLSLEALMVAV